MRINYLHQYFNTPKMTGGTRSHEMARRLVAMGHEVNMITSWREPNDRSEWFETEEAGIRVHWLPVPYSNDLSYSARVKAFVRFAVQSARKAASLSADVVLATSTPLTIALPGVYAARQQKIPMVFEVRDLWPELPIAIGALRNPIACEAARWLERFAYRNAKHVIALSPGMRDGVAETGYPADQITVIPNSCDLELFDPKTVDPTTFRNEHPEIGDKPLVVYAGTLGKINGVEYLARIAAVSLKAESPIQYVIVGRGGEEAKVQAAANELGVLGRNLHIFPPCSKQEMPKVLAAADLALSLFVDLKPMWANSANKFFDALASGTPVAVNYGGWQADLLTETNAGIILPANNPEVAARKILHFLGDRNNVIAASKAARKLAEERFSRDELAKKMESVLFHTVVRTQSTFHSVEDHEDR